MKRIHKQWITALLVLMLAIQLAACGSGTSDSSSQAVSEPSASEDSGGSGGTTANEVTIWSRGTETEPLAGPLIEALEKFEAENNVTVNYQFVPHSDVITKYNAAFASNTAPDVIDIGIVHLIGRINLGHIIPMDDYVADWAGKDDIFPQMLDLGTVNEHVYAIAHYPSPNIFVYRKDMFEQAGLDPESPPQSWDQLLEYAEKLTVYDGGGNIEISGFVMPTQGARFIANTMIRQNGSHFVDEANNSPTMTTPEAVETLEFMNALYQYSAAYDSSNDDSNPIWLDKGAMGYVASDRIKNYVTQNPEMKEKFGYVACVPGVESASWCGVHFYAMTSQAGDPDLAWSLIEHLTSEETLARRVESAGLSSTFQSASEKYASLDPEINQAIVDAISIGAGNPRVSWAADYEIELDQALEEVFYGVSTPEEALAKAQTNLEKSAQ